MTRGISRHLEAFRIDQGPASSHHSWLVRVPIKVGIDIFVARQNQEFLRHQGCPGMPGTMFPPFRFLELVWHTSTVHSML